MLCALDVYVCDPPIPMLMNANPTFSQSFDYTLCGFSHSFLLYHLHRTEITKTTVAETATTNSNYKQQKT